MITLVCGNIATLKCKVDTGWNLRATALHFEEIKQEENSIRSKVVSKTLERPLASVPL